ncbi:MAG: flagellar hook assembly protein FlgD [Panacagrimonas sp.]
MSIAPVSRSYSDLGLALRESDSDRAELGQQDFLRLMTTQLQHQDPFKPMESGEFLGQMAQFSTVSGIQSMQESLSGLTSALTSNQSLQAANLVGHGVMVPSNEGYLFAEGGLSGSAEVVGSGRLFVEVTDAAGQVVQRMDLGTRSAGTANFTWNGLDQAGNRMPEGVYGIRATVGEGAAAASASTQTMALVNSVSLGGSGVKLNLFGMGSVALADVREIL